MFTGLWRWLPVCALLLALLYASSMGSSSSSTEAERDLAPGPGNSIPHPAAVNRYTFFAEESSPEGL